MAVPKPLLTEFGIHYRLELCTPIVVVGYRLNRLVGPVFIAVPKPLLTEFGFHCRLESCGGPDR